jgi:AGCS family alanine or glycine:cation symporter
MYRFNALSRWLMATLTLLVVTASAQAQDEVEGTAAAASTMDSVDEAFGTYLVAPLFSVLFFDLWVFDNTMSADDVSEPLFGNSSLDVEFQRYAAGQMVRGQAMPDGADPYRFLLERAVNETAVIDPYSPTADPLFKRASDPSETGIVQVADVHIVSLAGQLPVIIEPVERTVGGVIYDVTVTDGQVVGAATGGQVDLAAMGIALGAAQLVSTDGSEVLLSIDAPEAPGVILQVASNGEVRSGGGPLSSDLLPIVAGMQVPVSAIRQIENADGELEEVVVQVSADVVSMDSLGRAAIAVPAAHSTLASIGNPRQLTVPFVVFWLILGAVYFTFRMMFVNVRMFGHAIAVTAGRYDHDEDPGEISHFQALSSALSATVGLGNISGVAIAVATGGPGAVFWMVLAGTLGMSSKFVECTLGQMYRRTNAKGEVSGGPMHYLSRGIVELAERRLGSSGKLVGSAVGYPLAAMFAVMCIGASFGGGNMFQANQSFAAVAGVAGNLAPSLTSPNAVFYMSLVYGIVLAILVGTVIMGGIKRIGVAAGVIVPVMCGVYLLAGIGVLAVNAAEVPAAIGLIVGEAFTPLAGLGGLMGVLVVGFQRAAFSNEAGVGSASIAHSAASTPEPVREGIVALLEPFIDTILVCTMTGLVVVVTGVYTQDTGDGVLMTSAAFETVFWWFPYVLTIAVVLFAFSTMISWSYYGERAAVWLFGDWARVPYKLMFVFFVVFGAVIKLGNVLDFSDLMVLGMAVPNIAGALLLSGHVKKALDSYRDKLNSGGFAASAGADG